MTRRAPVAGTAFGLHVALTVAVPFLIEWGDLMGWVAAVIILVQMSLLGVWLVFGRLFIAMRIGCVVLLLTSWLCLFTAMDENSTWDWRAIRLQLLFVGSPCAGSTLGLLPLKRKRHLIRLQTGEVATPEPTQFALRHLLAITIAAALLLTLQRHVRPLFDEIFGWLMDALMTVVVAEFLTFVLLGPVCTWATLGAGRLRVRLPVAVLIGCLACLLPPFFLQSAEGIPQFMVLAVGIVISTLLTLLAFRWDGFRVVRKEVVSTASEAG